MKVSSIFSQILQLIPRGEFAQIVQAHDGERHARGFTCWGQLVAMLFCQLGQARSLREIHEGLKASEGKLRHLGMRDSPSHSTLAYANLNRPWQIQQQLFVSMFGQLHGRLGLAGHSAKQFGLPGKLLSLDSTVIDLCAETFNWAKYKTTKGAVKVHLLLDHDGHLPRFAVVSEGRTSDIEVARGLEWAPDTMLVVDRGYNDYEWFERLTRQGAWFVTRMKENADYVVVEKREPEGEGVLGDEILCFFRHARQGRGEFYRRVVYWDAENEREFVFLTNHLSLAALTIAELYRQRWQIEQFFRALKQNLRVKTFVGTSANALKIQIWTALLAVLLVRFLQLSSRIGWHLSRFLALLRQQLFVYRCLWRFLDEPFEAPPQPPPDLQYPLFPDLPAQFGQPRKGGHQPHSPNEAPAHATPCPAT